MKVKIGNVAFSDATVRRFIDLQSSLPLSMIHISYTDQTVDDGELTEAFKKNTIIPFECEILRTRVLVNGFGHEGDKDFYILQEPAADVSCDYKTVDWTQPTGNTKMVFVIPEDVEDLRDPYELSLLPYRRLILRKDIPNEWFRQKQH
jgi:hypothetical protein